PGNRAVVLGRKEQQAIGILDLFAEFEPFLGRSAFEILVEVRQVSDVQKGKREGFGRNGYHGIGCFSVEGFLPKASYYDGNFVISHNATGFYFYKGNMTRCSFINI